MFTWFAKLFQRQPEVLNGPLWRVMEEMDPLLSYRRFQALSLPCEQEPIVNGLICGATKPSEVDAVRDWAEETGQDENGVDAIVFALQLVMGGTDVHYLFAGEDRVPSARFPNYTDKDTLTVLFSDRAHHLQIATLQEFLEAHQIRDHSLEILDDKQLRERITGQPAPPRRQRRPSVNLERKADADDRVQPPVGIADIAEALNREGYQVTADDVRLETPLQKLGLYTVPVRLEPNGVTEIAVWVVPSVD